MGRCGSGRVGAGGLYTAPGSARPPGNDSLGMIGCMAKLFNKWFAADDAIHTIFIERAALPSTARMKLPSYFSDGFLNDRFSLISCRSHQRIIIVQGDHGEDDVFGEGMGRADEALRTASAFETVNPEHRNAGLGFHRVGDLGRIGWSQPKRGGRKAAIFEEAASCDPLTPHYIIKCFCQ